MNNLVQLRSIGAKGAVLTPAPWTYSASQLRKYHECQRSWYFAKILRYPTGTSKAAEYGKDLHGQVEKYIQDGTEPTDDRAWVLLRNLGGVDLTREDLTVEGKVQFLVRPEDMGGPRFLGYIDLIEPTSESLRIIDHKTTSDLKWAKSEYELHSDIQMIAYAHWAFMQLPHLNELEVVHNYVTTKGVPNPRVVTATLTRSEVTERWNQDHLALIEKMEVTRQLDDVRNVPVTLSSCGKYGGCPHSEVCDRAQFGQEIEMFNPPDAAQPGETKEATMSNSALDRLAALRARAGITPTPAPEKVEAKEPERVAAPAPIELEVEGLEVIASEPVQPAPEPAPEESQAGYELSATLTDYGFGTRARTALKILGVQSKIDLLALDAGDALKVKNCGDKVVDELKAAQVHFVNGPTASPVPEPALVEDSDLQKLAAREAEALQELSPVPLNSVATEGGDDLTLSQIKAAAERFGAKITIEIGG